MRLIAYLLIGVIFAAAGVGTGVVIGKSERNTVLQVPAGCNISVSDTVAHLKMLVGTQGSTGIKVSAVKADISNLEGTCLHHAK